MQLVLSGDRIIAHGENFLAMGGVVINTETGAKYENATVTESNGCPSDIDKVGYKYKAGVFVPCAPFAGNGNNNGYFMEVCEDCATPRNSGIPIKKGIGLANLASDVTAHALGGAEFTLLWSLSYTSVFEFKTQTISLSTLQNYDLVAIEFIPYFNNNDDLWNSFSTHFFPTKATTGRYYRSGAVSVRQYYESGAPSLCMRGVGILNGAIQFDYGYALEQDQYCYYNFNAYAMVPRRIYGVKI